MDARGWRLWQSAGLILVLCLILSTGDIRPVTAQDTATLVFLQAVRDVVIYQPAESTDGQQLALGSTQAFNTNDTIDMSQGSKATLQFPDSLLVTLFHDTQLRFEASINVAGSQSLIPSLRLLHGTLIIDKPLSDVAQDRLNITTGAAQTVSIRLHGTNVLVYYDDATDTTWVVSHEGTATVSAGGSDLTVFAGTQTYVPMDQPAAPLLPADRTAIGNLFPTVDFLTDQDIPDGDLLPTPTPVPTSAPPAPPEPGVPTDTPIPTQTPIASGPTCDPLQGPSLSFGVGDKSIDVTWGVQGGCGPYTGVLTAAYANSNFTRDFAISGQTGTWHDTPPAPRCDADNTIQYSLRIRDEATRQEVPFSATTTLGGPCTSTPLPSNTPTSAPTATSAPTQTSTPTPTPTPIPTPTPVPAQVTGVAASVSPSSYSGLCPGTFTFNGRISVSGPTTVTYQWTRSDGAIAPRQTLTFGGAGSSSVSTTWTLGGPGLQQFAGWEAIQIFSPNQVTSNQANFTMSCALPPH